MGSWDFGSRSQEVRPIVNREREIAISDMECGEASENSIWSSGKVDLQGD